MAMQDGGSDDGWTDDEAPMQQEREGDRSNFTLFYTKAQLATAVRNAHSLGFSAIVKPGHNCDFLWNFQVERIYLRAESFKWS